MILVIAYTILMALVVLLVVGFVWFTKLIIKLANGSDKDDV